jgi:competence protein ComEA
LAKTADVQPEPQSPAPPIPAAADDPVQNARAPVTVDVRGAVASPGIYTLTQRDRVNDAIDAAGGMTPQADASDINMLARLIDGTTLTVPQFGGAEVQEGRLIVRRGTSGAVVNPPSYTLSASRFGMTANGDAAASPESGAATAAPAADSATGGLISLNAATKAQLETLPGIGPVTADKIIEHRRTQPFTTVEELQNVRGIGEKKLEAIRHLVTP